MRWDSWSLKYAKSNPKPLQSLSKYPQLGLTVPTKDDTYKPPEFPPIWSLTSVIGAWSKPFEKHLTQNDARDDQSRLSINKAYVGKFLLLLLNITMILLREFSSLSMIQLVRSTQWRSRYGRLSFMFSCKGGWSSIGIMGCKSMKISSWRSFVLSSFSEHCWCSNP